MKKISRRVKYDFIIYTCLLLAVLLIGYSANYYIGEESYSLKELLFKEEKEVIVPKETEELKKIDKKELLNNYLIDILEEIKKDPILTRDIINSWSTYEILNIKYNRQIANDYYSYLVDIKINNLDAILPTNKNNELSTNEYVVISLNVNIEKNQETLEYSIKNIDIAKNN